MGWPNWRRSFAYAVGRVEGRLGDPHRHRADHGPRDSRASASRSGSPRPPRRGGSPREPRSPGDAARPSARRGSPSSAPSCRRRSPGIPGSTRNAVMPRGPLARVHGGEQRDDARVRAVGAPQLGAVEDVPVALPDGRGPERRRVGARAGLRERVRGEQLARGEPRQVAALLRLGARQEDRVAAEGRRPPVGRGRRARPRDLLGDQGEGQRAHVAAAVGLREPDPHQPLLREEPHGLLGIRLGLVVMGGDRGDLLPRDRPRELHAPSAARRRGSRGAWATPAPRCGAARPPPAPDAVIGAGSSAGSCRTSPPRRRTRPRAPGPRPRTRGGPGRCRARSRARALRPRTP